MGKIRTVIALLAIITTISACSMPATRSKVSAGDEMRARLPGELSPAQKKPLKVPDLSMCGAFLGKTLAEFRATFGEEPIKGRFVSGRYVMNWLPKRAAQAGMAIVYATGDSPDSVITAIEFRGGRYSPPNRLKPWYGQ